MLAGLYIGADGAEEGDVAKQRYVLTLTGGPHNQEYEDGRADHAQDDGYGQLKRRLPPRLGEARPQMILARVVFPAPLGPIKAVTSPLGKNAWSMFKTSCAP